MRALSPLALGLTLAATMASASAQTVVSRTVTEELVETTVVQDARGTVVIRRVLPAPAVAPVQPWQAPAPVVAYDPAPAYPRPPLAYDVAPGYAPPVRTVVELEPDTVDIVTTRQYVRPATRTVTRTTRVGAKAPIVARTDPPAVRRVQRPVVLSPAERRVVYRTIVQQQVAPAAPVVREPYVARDAYWGAPIVARDDVVAPALAPAPVVYLVGAVLPAAAPIYGVPETVAVRVPVVRPYSYSYVGGRVYLVDPATGVIVADVTQY